MFRKRKECKKFPYFTRGEASSFTNYKSGKVKE